MLFTNSATKHTVDSGRHSLWS